MRDATGFKDAKKPITEITTGPIIGLAIGLRIRPAMGPETGLARGLGTKPATRPVTELESAEGFSIGPTTGPASPKQLSLSQINICYSH